MGGGVENGAGAVPRPRHVRRGQVDRERDDDEGRVLPGRVPSGYPSERHGIWDHGKDLLWNGWGEARRPEILPRRRSTAQYRLPGAPGVAQQKLQRTRAAIHVFLNGEEQVRAPRGVDGDLLAVERHAGKTPPVLRHREPQVAPPRADAGHLRNADVPEEEQRLLVPRAEGAEPIEIGQKVRGDLADPELRVDRLPQDEGRLPRVLFCDLRKALAERVEVLEGKREAGRPRVSSVPRQQVGQARQGRDEVEPLDAAARPLRRAVLLLEQNDRAAVSLEDLGGDDPQDPGVPGGIRQHDRRGDLPRRREGGFHRGGDPLLLPLPKRVVLVQLPGEAGGVLPGHRDEDPGAAGRVADPAGRVQPRADPEAQVRLRRRAVRHARCGEQRLDPGTGRLADLPEPLPHEEPVPAPEGRHIGDRTEGDQIQVLPQGGLRKDGESPRLPHRLAQRAHEQEGDPHARHLLLGKRAIGLHRVQDGERLRKSPAREVMVRHDHLDPFPPRRP